MNLKRGDRVKIINKGDIEGEVVGFYAHTMDAVIRTETGNEWIVSPVHLEAVKRCRKKTK
tara:strand:- start:171 stop:350 length:180 start_codon:yes stop_codon:yes gene_type:complete